MAKIKLKKRERHYVYLAAFLFDEFTMEFSFL